MSSTLLTTGRGPRSCYNLTIFVFLCRVGASPNQEEIINAWTPFIQNYAR